jgi:hypothetical protein
MGNGQIQKRGKNRILVILIAILVVILLIVVINFKTLIESYSTNNYYSRYKAVYSDLDQSERQCESVVSDVSTIWYDAIYGGGNGNYRAVLDALYSGVGNKSNNASTQTTDLNISEWMKESEINNFRKDVADIRTMQTQLDKNMKKLVNPPDEYKRAYAEILSLYDIYKGLSNQALSPNGTYQTYASDVNKKTDDFKAEFEKIQVMFPDIEK